jgi:trans-2,3-dihydro-3-hydroxyanthranilate isomerase
MLQNAPEHGAARDPARVLAAQGWSRGRASRASAQVVSTDSRTSWRRCAPRRPSRAPRPRRCGAVRAAARDGPEVLYLAVLDPDAGRRSARGFFADPGIVAEDPATGSAAGPLCAYAAARTGTTELVVSRAWRSGRPSRIACAMAPDGGVRVSGDVVIVMTGEVAI